MATPYPGFRQHLLERLMRECTDLNEKVSMITHGDDVPLFVYRVEECKEGEIDERAN